MHGLVVQVVLAGLRGRSEERSRLSVVFQKIF